MKREVYDGYTEYYWAGNEVKEYFKKAYGCFGRHHGQISSTRMKFDKYYSRIKEDKTYRIFLSDIFCLVLNSETDSKLYFFGYTFEKPDWAVE